MCQNNGQEYNKAEGPDSSIQNNFKDLTFSG